MTSLKWWMRVVGALYVFLFVASAILRLPIRAEGPEGLLDRASAGDATARFVVVVWVTFGLYLGAVGVALLINSRVPEQARALVGTAMGMEFAGIAADVYKIARGYELAPPVPWMVIHSVIIVTGLLFLRRVRSAERARPAAGQTPQFGT